MPLPMVPAPITPVVLMSMIASNEVRCEDHSCFHDRFVRERDLPKLGFHILAQYPSKRLVDKIKTYHRYKLAPQVQPAPMAANKRRSPSWMPPSRFTWSSTSGTEAPAVFAHNSRFVRIRL